MGFQYASKVDILRCFQKDEQFVELYSNFLSDIVRLSSNKNYNRVRKYLPYLSQTGYYLLTSLSNLQTLGEEYTGILRFRSETLNIPCKWIQLIWTVCFICGKDVHTKCINALGNTVNKSNTLSKDAKSTFNCYRQFLQENEDVLTRLHLSLFYMFGKYYNIASRLTKIEYVLLRKSNHLDSSDKLFKVLGLISYFYLVYTLVNNAVNLTKENTSKNVTVTLNVDVSGNRKDCFLCTEEKTNPCIITCGHVFCWTCIFDIIKYESKCPVCREEFQPDRVIHLQNY